jgi:tetratricopeptide (TPR) repeat protein
MNMIYRLVAASILLLAASFSFADGTVSNAPLPSLRLSEERTQQNRIDFLLGVAQAYTKEGDLASAIDAYDRILAIDPGHGQTRYLVSHAYIQTKQYNRAISLILELIEERPQDFTLLNNLAWIYATAEDPAIRNGDKAVDYAHKAMVLAPNDHHVWSTLAEAYYTSGDYEKAYRAIKHMALLVNRYGRGITEESVQEYREQFRKCKRAMDTAEAMEELE